MSNNDPQTNIDNINIVQTNIENPYKDFTFTIQPGATIDVFYVWDMFRVIALTGDTNALRVRFGSSGQETIFPDAGLGYKAPYKIDRHSLRNAGATVMNVTIAVGVGDIRDDRVNLVGGVIPVDQLTSDGAPVSNAVTVGTTAVALTTASTTRKKLTIYNNGSVPIYIGGAGVLTTDGLPILPNNYYSSDFDGSVIYAISGTAGQDVRVYEHD